MNKAIIISVLAMTIRLMVPYLYASLGEMYSQKSGVMNLGLEANMTVGAFVAFVVAYFANNHILALFVAVLCGMVFGLLYGIFVIYLGLDQPITGISMNLLVLGSAAFFYRLIFGVPTVLPFASSVFGTFDVPLLSKIPFLGEILFQQYSLVYFAFILLIFSIFFFKRTKQGIVIISCGENPRAAETRGVRVNLVRLGTVVFSSAIAAVAGAYLSIGQYNQYTAGMVAGRGYIAFALVIFGQWNPKKILYGSLLFGFLEAFSMMAQTYQLIPHQILLMMPYAITVIALIITTFKSRSARPACLGVRYTESK